MMAEILLAGVQTYWRAPRLRAQKVVAGDPRMAMAAAVRLRCLVGSRAAEAHCIVVLVVVRTEIEAGSQSAVVVALGNSVASPGEKSAAGAWEVAACP